MKLDLTEIPNFELGDNWIRLYLRHGDSIRLEWEDIPDRQKLAIVDEGDTYDEDITIHKVLNA